MLSEYRAFAEARCTVPLPARGRGSSGLVKSMRSRATHPCVYARPFARCTQGYIFLVITCLSTARSFAATGSVVRSGTGASHEVDHNANGQKWKAMGPESEPSLGQGEVPKCREE